MANDTLSKALAKNYAGKAIPSAAMAGLFQEAALSYVQTLDLPGRDTEEKENALAARMALKAAYSFVNGASIDEAMLAFTAETVDEDSGETREERAVRELREATEEYYGSVE